MTRSRLFLALAPVALLAACGGDKASESDGRSASGEVLEGTISDAMLPLDSVRSQPPLAAPRAGARTSAAAEDAATEAPEGEASGAGQGAEQGSAAAAPAGETPSASVEE